ncbi:MAG: GGDEF domain-containing protein [Bacillota bacterium]|nr:GGDEF domain-containing protein [Bacillota bacterium]
MTTIKKLGGLIPSAKSTLLRFWLFAILFFIARTNYLFFHTIAEGFAIIIIGLIFVLANSTYKHSGNGFLLFLGNAYLFVGIIDFFHLATFKGMGIFPNYDANTPTQLWIAARYIEAVSLLIAPYFINRKFSRNLQLIIYSTITGILLASIMIYPIFPDCYIEGAGLTLFKIYSEYIISLLLATTIVFIFRSKENLNTTIYYVMLAAVTTTILAELSFTLYTDVYGIMNFTGHIFKLISFYYIYRGIIMQGIEAPFDLIFEKLKTNAITDFLTGLYNRQGLMEFTKKELARMRRDGNKVGAMVIDLDNFKVINDTYGHLIGDEVLVSFAAILKSSIRETDIACRLGGDEFILLINADLSDLALVRQRITEAFNSWLSKENKFHELGISIGCALLDPEQPFNIDEIIRKADQEMYLEKAKKTI